MIYMSDYWRLTSSTSSRNDLTVYTKEFVYTVRSCCLEIDDLRTVTGRQTCLCIFFIFANYEKFYERKWINDWCFRPWFCAVRLYWAGHNLSYNKNEWMIGVLGHDFALLRLYWAGDNLGKWDEFCYESCPWHCLWFKTCTCYLCQQHSSCWDVVITNNWAWILLHRGLLLSSTM